MSKKMTGIPLEGFAQLCREAAAQGAVLLKNDDNTLPVTDGECVSVFGRIQIQPGYGSGWKKLVNKFFNLFCSGAEIFDIFTAAFRTAFRYGKAFSAVVADPCIFFLVIG